LKRVYAGAMRFSALLLLAACATAPAASTPAPPADDCTFATALVPGIPGSPGHLIPSERNPNGASELATMMRLMQEDLGAARLAVLAQRPPPAMWSRHRKMRCSWPTDPADRNGQFDGLAQTYLAQVKALDVGQSDPAKAYDNVLTACRACHDASCPGPVEVIEGLRLPKSP
jgi:hypothetical protein